MDKSREQFELWWLGNFSRHSLSAKTLCFDAWQESRAELVVELPAPCYRAEYVDHCSNDLEWDNYFEIEEVKSALSEAGIKCG